MTVAFFSNYLNHHQVYVADEFYREFGAGYTFIASNRNIENELKGGADYSDRPYYICVEESKENYREALRIACSVDVALFDGHEVRSFALARARKGLLSFEVGERILKKGILNLLSPHLLMSIWCYYSLYRKKPFYHLCASAFAANDLFKLGMYRGRCYKWGYFTSLADSIDEKHDGDESGTDNHDNSVRFLWCSRFINWKHPELAIQLAEMLKRDQYSFRLDMYGDGSCRIEIEDEVDQKKLSDCVFFHGNRPNAEIHKAMKECDIFLFTSDKKEGWGVVANEAMMNKCCIVGSDEIGAVPYLVKNRENGMIFQSKSINSLYEAVCYVISNKDVMVSMAERGFGDVMNVWSPQNAVSNFIQLVNDLLNGKPSSILEGPCSKA